MSFENLPNELLYQVHRYLTNKSIAKFSCTSHVFNLYSLSTNEIQCLYTSEDILYKACVEGYLQLLKIIIARGDDINHQNEFNETALHWAINYNNDKNIVQILLKNKADINHQDNYGFTALHRTCYNNDKECVQVLLKNKADPNILNIDGNTALHMASLRGHKKCVQLLLEHDVNINQQNNYDTTALDLAIIYNRKECMQILIKNRADTKY